ncbi:iron-sulfur cluster co-chaperone protein HscB, mitochondrial isoform X2 [Cinnamomum micranthum f. kanehirae]|uniref:Iron-sulfur cluster co-chaperone protein HscB, mitochondrial isoform X2 n=1 Tax=Cinnamomum micranthum f. kanehirae TaxID=337451 RepID=A0A443N9K1_9MAGN|nr:iron-sulfur cluster co-chaperone protein HscB, mitochondrial isoform X2 [Cinnamomum micranthum f. kanehirae]
MHVCYPFSTVDVLANIWICPSASSSSVSPSLLLHLRRQPPRRARAFHCVYDRSLDSRVSSSSFCSESAERSVERCWNCSAAAESKPFLSCGACRSVQSVDRSVDYFQIFGLEKRYDIQTENLESKYKDWQKKLHPDLVHSKSEKEKAYAAEQSARVIDAYRTLRKPLLRAMYLMRLEGEPVDEEQIVSDPELLAEVTRRKSNLIYLNRATAR